jgi:tetratricopeptide (TPR) repeat protein
VAPADRLVLPERPPDQRDAPVALWREPVRITTYEPLPPSPHPMFLESRVYQGSSGRVYPLPFYERVSQEPTSRTWDAVHLENSWLRLMVLPELGGRIHVGLDRSNGYDFFYRQNVIKPALVGLAGPWVSGGVELNWPQHHRPATYLPVDVALERGADGSATAWCSDHDPMARMKGMHGVRLRPDRAVVELSVRLHNRTDEVQTFLWWANVGVRVHEQYQAFFPVDVVAVADHAKRAMTTYPHASGLYYGIDYPARARELGPDADRLDWYRNIPVPTSYMVIGTSEDFFGGYDHAADAGFVHWADHRIAPGKKLWTWGDAPFGHAWNRNLTDEDGPYIELMAGVYTDNQPDFSFLAPGETKAFVQQWYPLSGTGPVHCASPDAAARVDVAEGRVAVTLAVTAPQPDLAVVVRAARDDRTVASWHTAAAPGPAVRLEAPLEEDLDRAHVLLEVGTPDRVLLRWRRPQPPDRLPRPARPAPPPEAVASTDELYVTGLHLLQYRHPTRLPEPYWQEAVRRDAEDARSRLALATWHHDRAEQDMALEDVERAVDRLTLLNPNPRDGEAHYRLGRVLRALGRPDDAYDAFFKATWNAGWRAAASFALAQLEAQQERWDPAEEHLQRCLAVEADHLRARDLLVMVLRRQGREQEASRWLADTLALDPLDWWAHDLAGTPLGCDSQTRLDVALEYAAAGFRADALAVLAGAELAAGDEPYTGSVPMLRYHRAALLAAGGDDVTAATARAHARAADLRYCFPSRLADQQVLQAALEADPHDPSAAQLLALWLYDRRRHAEALALWRRVVGDGAADSGVWRNLGIGVFNVEGDAGAARDCYERAVALAPGDGRLWYERDQLARRTGVPPQDRLAALAPRWDVVAERDDLSVEVAQALDGIGEPDRALELLSSRRFQPWEGGEGQVLGAWERTQLLRARRALSAGDPVQALTSVQSALEPPDHLGEARHPLANTAHLLLCLGDVRAAAGEEQPARQAWRAAAEVEGDFQQMAVRPYSELTYFSVLALQRLGDDEAARLLADAVEHYAGELATTPAVLDYFATSLPQLLLFRDDLDLRQRQHSELLLAQVALARHKREEAVERLQRLLAQDPNLGLAVDLHRAVVEGRDT